VHFSLPFPSNPGSVKLDHEKVPIEVQRLYDHEIGGTIGLKTYRKLHQMEPPENAVIDGIIKGLSMSDYQAVIGRPGGKFWIKSFQCEFKIH